MTSILEKLDGEIAAIELLSRDQLAARWAKIYGYSPPAIRRDLLSHAIAWEVQSKRIGGYSPDTKRRLRQAIAKVSMDVSARHDTAGGATMGSPRSSSTDAIPAPSRFSSPLSVGARLVRVWNGHTNVVDVVQDGYVFEGALYRSLSAIARKITRAHWSGPRFFGL